MEINHSLENLLSKLEITDFCRRYFTKSVDENLDVISFEYTSVEGAPKGFLGRHCFLNVLICRKTINNHNLSSSPAIHQDKIKFFIKSSPHDVPAQMEYCEEFGVFRKEVNVCKYLLPRLFDINIGKDCYFASKCYLAKPHVLVFENLVEQGFRLGAQSDGILDYNHLLCTLKSLATMHAASIALEQRTRKLIPEMYAACVEENSYPNDPNNVRSIVFKKAVSALSDLLKMIPKYQDLSNLDDILKLFAAVLKQIFEFVKPSEKFRNVFNHGDLWANNIMFKYNNEGKGAQKVPVNCRLVDFQLGRYAPPALDVMTVLTIPTSSEFRRHHLNDLVEKYYKFFTQNLAEHDIAVEDVLPRIEYNASIEHYKLAGIIESCLFSHLTNLPECTVSGMLNNSDNFDEFLTKNRNEVCIKTFNESKMYRERLTDMITDLVDNYVLKETTKL